MGKKKRSRPRTTPASSAQRARTPRAQAEAPVVVVPPFLRVGGAFLALAIVLALFTLISLITGGLTGFFPVTWGFLLIIVSAMLLGAFGTTHRNEERTTRHIVVLVVAVGLVVFSRFITTEPIYILESWWLPVYATMALICALVIRRTVA
ncbi:hypothetical protein [Corynebacterium sp. TAE3-ERU2]|uniref:hypothetical protein n=1 Tax=Corynebacterium sp. TAE3-ERU2 TaxID=2849497 RepID=UPI001C452A6E|nr:hypothetical protein [Corynebacterium sp. TAE3-ERU2]MBV7302614.1 hypothetical protein [Corynebacterium sp. TAE3-ERU2]